MPRKDPLHDPITRGTGEYPRDELDLGWAIAKVSPCANRVVIADRFLPESIDVVSKDVPDVPSIVLRLEIVEGVPACTEVQMRQRTSAGVRQTDLHTLNLTEIANDVFAAMSWPATIAPDGKTIVLAIGGGTSDRGHARRSFNQQRRRKITPELLQTVAQTFREHESERPIEAVAAVCQVKDRMAVKYVRMARDAGYLEEPKRKKGAKS